MKLNRWNGPEENENPSSAYCSILLCDDEEEKYDSRYM